jgi:hypothetical protein
MRIRRRGAHIAAHRRASPPARIVARALAEAFAFPSQFRGDGGKGATIFWPTPEKFDTDALHGRRRRMGFAKAEWMSTEPTGAPLPACDVFPPSSQQDFIATLPGVAPGASPPAPPYSSRPMAETHAYTPPRSSRKEQATATAGDDPRTEWCVDFGTALATMDTFELWAAIDRGDVVASMRVWREGMECWTPIGQVLDLALALQTPSTSRTPGPVAFPEASHAPYTVHMPHAMHVAQAPRTSVAPAVSTPPAARGSLVEPTAQTEGRATVDTLISGPRPSAWGRLSHRVMPGPSLRQARAQLWIAAGSAIAGLAVLTAVARVELTAGSAAPAGVPVAVVQVAALPPEAPIDGDAEAPSMEAPAAEAPTGVLEAAALEAAALEATAPAASASAQSSEQVGVPAVLRDGPGAPGVSGVSGVTSAPSAAPKLPRDVHRDDYGQRRRGRSGRHRYGW